MPSVGTGSVDIRSIISNIINVVKSRANAVCTAPCDGAVLKMHYRWTFFLLIGGFFTVWYQWYHRDVITCVSHFNAETQVRLDYINICLSYPYVETDEKDEAGNNKKRYLLFYRWIQWSFLVAAAIYYIPRKVSKHMENPKCKKLIEELAANSSRYDNAETVLIDKITMYMMNNIRTHNGLYIKFLFLNILALFIDLVALHYFDFLLQGRFLTYGYMAYPFERDPDTFTDYMSQMFPPFAMCYIDAEKQIVNRRAETFGCHLTIMELYEKVFLGLWVWLIILITITALYIVFLLLAFIPKAQEIWLRTSRPHMAPEKTNVLIRRVSHNLKIGDVYLLYRFKSHLSHARFYELLMRLADPKLNSSNRPGDQTVIDSKPPAIKQPLISQHQPAPVGHQQPNPDPARNRKLQQSINPPMNPDYISQMYSNPDNLARHGGLVPGGPNNQDQRQPLLNKNNTSILIE